MNRYLHVTSKESLCLTWISMRVNAGLSSDKHDDKLKSDYAKEIARAMRDGKAKVGEDARATAKHLLKMTHPKKKNGYTVVDPDEDET